MLGTNKGWIQSISTVLADRVLRVPEHTIQPLVTMNNAQFRRLVVDTPDAKAGLNVNVNAQSSTPRRDGVSSAALGSRLRSNIPMTPWVLARPAVPASEFY